MQSWKIPYPWRLVHLRKKYVPVKILWFASPHGKGPFQTNFPPPPHINSLSGIPNHMPGLVLTPSLAHCLNKLTFIHNSWSKQSDIYFHFGKLVMWKVWRRNRFQSQIHPLRECKGPYKKKVLIKLNTSFLLIFNLLLLGLWLSYWMWFQSWWKNNLFWLSRWENFFLWSQHSSCDEDNRGSLCSMHRCCLPPHPTQLGGNLWVGWAG